MSELYEWAKLVWSYGLARNLIMRKLGQSKQITSLKAAELMLHADAKEVLASEPCSST